MLLKKGERAKAKVFLKRALLLNPSDQGAKDLLDSGVPFSSAAVAYRGSSVEPAYAKEASLRSRLPPEPRTGESASLPGSIEARRKRRCFASAEGMTRHPEWRCAAPIALSAVSLRAVLDGENLDSIAVVVKANAVRPTRKRNSGGSVPCRHFTSPSSVRTKRAKPWRIRIAVC